MATIRISERGSVQFPMVAHAVEMGWVPVTPETVQRMRGGEAEMLFQDEVERKLCQFNPWMSGDNVQQVIEQLGALPANIEGNREMLLWLRGERQGYDEEENRQRPVRLIDFENPEKNTFHVTWEWKIKSPNRKSNRADVIFLINGVPIAIVEHKNPKDGDAIDQAVTQLRRYEKDTPELLATPQVFNVTHLLDYWYGVTWNISRRYMARWKEPPHENYKFAVQAFFEPTEFLRMLQHWILFYVEDGETRKSVLRQHQRVAIDKILERCEEPLKKRGLIWHTQGSGKTFTLLTAARMILENKVRFGSATVILVVDRIELEGQLKGWVEKLIGEMQGRDIPVWQAKSRDNLSELLTSGKRGLIVSMIHKFEGLEKDADTRKGIYVFIDEAHRSVAKELGTFLTASVPNATIIGFTGTPINQTSLGKGTFKIFGRDDKMGYLDKYSISESIEDETTLPIRHAMAPSDMVVPAEQLDKEFFQLADAEGITDIEELNKVLERAVGLRTFLTADDRIEKVASFVAEHFKEKVEPLGYKAFLVGVNREACAKYKRALDQRLPPEWSEAIYTQDQADTVHKPLVAEIQLSSEREADVRLLFKKDSENPKILIITDKLLTGYDAPLLYCMYLDKPMRDHVLLQAIARVNRPYIDKDNRQKPCGLVIDFVGVLRELEKALRFDSKDVSGIIVGLDLLLESFIEKITAAKIDYLDNTDEGSADERLENMIYGRFLDPEPRKHFFDVYKKIESLWEILSPSPELRDYIDTFKQLAQLYATTRNAYMNRSAYVADLARKTSRLIQQSATQQGLERLTRSVTFDVETLKNLHTEPGSDEGKVFNLLRGLQKEIEEKPEMAPVLQTLQARAERILEDMQNRKITGLTALEQLAALAKKKEEVLQSAHDSGLSPRGISVYLTLEDAGSYTVRASAKQLAEKADMLYTQFPNAAVNADEQRRLRAGLYGPLLDIGLEQPERTQVVNLVYKALVGYDRNE